MRNLVRVGAFILFTTLVSTHAANGQILGVVDSNVEGYFAATSDTFQQAEGPTIPPWPVAGTGYYPTSGIPTVPPLYPGFPNPAIPLTSNIPYTAPFAHAPSNPFTDGQTTATYSIIGGFFGPGTNTGDAYVLVGVPGAVPLTITQPSTASGYAYEQVNFAMVYSVGGGGLAAGPAGPRPFHVSGTLATGGWAQFGAEVNYWWLDTIPGTIIVSNTTLLGTLVYDFKVTSTSSFSQWVNHNNPALLGATGNGFLMITGSAFVAGDPFSITVMSVPEPTTAVMLGIGVIGLVLAGGQIHARKRPAP
jgi:hypothetical protein